MGSEMCIRDRIGAIVTILALANHAYYQRLNLSTFMVFVVGLWIIARKSDLAMKAIILGCCFLFLPQTISNIFSVRAVDRDVTNTLNVMRPLLDEYQAGHTTRLTVYDFDETLTKQEKNIKRSRAYIKQVLGINLFLYLSLIHI